MLLDWFKKKLAYIKIEVNETNANVVCYWPTPKTPEEGSEIAQQIASLIITSFKPNILNPILTAINSFAKISNTENVANTVEYLLSNTHAPVESNKPVVGPRAVFKND
jgi:glucan biosynthesis protein